jgi:hypothetical protein
MLAIFLILMYTVSLILHGAMDVTIYNRYSDIRLASPIYFCNCGTYYEYPIERTKLGTMMKIGFRFDLDQDEPGGILMYEVQRNRNAKSDHQPNTDITSTESVEDTSKMIRLLVAWKIEHSLESNVRILLIEHRNELVLNEAKLEHLYNKVNDIPSGAYVLLHRYRHDFPYCTWLICDNTVMGVAYTAERKVGLELMIGILEGAKDEYTKSALWIDSER